MSRNLDELDQLVERLRPQYALVVRKGDVIYAVQQMLFTSAILADLNFCGYEDRWCYGTLQSACFHLGDWLWAPGGMAPEPRGWHRHPASGRRRPDGDAAREHVRR